MEKPSRTGKRVLHYQLRLLDCTIKEDKKFLFQSAAKLTDFLEKKINLIAVDKKGLKLNICCLWSRNSGMIKASLAGRNHCGLSAVEVIGRKWNIYTCM